MICMMYVLLLLDFVAVVLSQAREWVYTIIVYTHSLAHTVLLYNNMINEVLVHVHATINRIDWTGLKLSSLIGWFMTTALIGDNNMGWGGLPASTDKKLYLIFVCVGMIDTGLRQSKPACKPQQPMDTMNELPLSHFYYWHAFTSVFAVQEVSINK